MGGGASQMVRCGCVARVVVVVVVVVVGGRRVANVGFVKKILPLPRPTASAGSLRKKSRRPPTLPGSAHTIERSSMSKLRCTCLLFLLLALVAGVPTAPSAADAEKLQSEAEHNMRQADATIEQLQTDMKRMDTFAEEVRRNLDEEARAKQDLSHALGYFHRQMQLSSDERDVSHSRVSRLEAEVVALQRKVHQLEGQVETCHKDKVSAGFCRAAVVCPSIRTDRRRTSSAAARNHLSPQLARPTLAGHADRGEQARRVHDVRSVRVCTGR